MPNDLIGYLGLDVKEFEGGIKRAEVATGRLAKAGKFLTSIFTGALILQAARSFADLGREIDATRTKLIKGTKEYEQFSKAAGGENSFSAPNNTLAAAGRELKNVWVTIRRVSLEALQGNIMFMEEAGAALEDWWKGNTNRTDALKKERALIQERASLAQSLLDQEDAISKKKAAGIVTVQEHQELMAMELQMLKDHAKLLSTGPKQDREKVQQLKEQIATRAVELQQLTIAEELEANRAEARTDSMRAEIGGMQTVAKLIDTIADYEEKILKARYEGKYVLEQQLKLQRDLSTEQLRVAEHNMTPRERLEARRAARKFARNLRQVTGSVNPAAGGGVTLGTDQDLARRLAIMEAQGDKPTPGSALDRFKNMRDAQRAGRERAGRAAAAADPQARANALLESIDQTLKEKLDFKLK